MGSVGVQFGFNLVFWGLFGAIANEKILLEQIDSGAGFLVSGRGGWEAKVPLPCKRHCTKTRLNFTLSQFYVFQAPILTPQIDVCGECSRHYWSLVCAFSNDVMLMSP